MGVNGELAKQGDVAASRKTSRVPACALATAIKWQIQTMVNELSLLRLKLILVMNTHYSKHRLSYHFSKILNHLQITRLTNPNLGTMQI